MTKPQIIETPGGQRMVVIPEVDYRRLAEAAEDAADIATADRIMARIRSGEDEAVPLEIAERLLAGENKIRVWREFRGLKVKELAEKAGIKAPFLSQIEGGQRSASIETYKALARALKVDVDDLID